MRNWNHILGTSVVSFPHELIRYVLLSFSFLNNSNHILSTCVVSFPHELRLCVSLSDLYLKKLNHISSTCMLSFSHEQLQCVFSVLHFYQMQSYMCWIECSFKWLPSTNLESQIEQLCSFVLPWASLLCVFKPILQEKLSLRLKLCSRLILEW